MTAFPDFETAQKAIRAVLEKYVGRSPLTPVALEMIRSEIHTCMLKLNAATDDNCDPYFNLTAHDARCLGLEVPEHVPACAAARFMFESPKPDERKPDQVVLKLTQRTEWKWVEFNFVV